VASLCRSRSCKLDIYYINNEPSHGSNNISPIINSYLMPNPSQSARSHSTKSRPPPSSTTTKNTKASRKSTNTYKSSQHSSTSRRTRSRTHQTATSTSATSTTTTKAKPKSKAQKGLIFLDDLGILLFCYPLSVIHDFAFLNLLDDIGILALCKPMRYLERFSAFLAGVDLDVVYPSSFVVHTVVNGKGSVCCGAST